jgi:hypothetical protein
MQFKIKIVFLKETYFVVVFVEREPDCLVPKKYIACR